MISVVPTVPAATITRAAVTVRFTLRDGSPARRCA